MQFTVTQLLTNSCLTDIARQIVKQQTGTYTEVPALQELPAGTFSPTLRKDSGSGSVLTSLPLLSVASQTGVVAVSASGWFCISQHCCFSWEDMQTGTGHQDREKTVSSLKMCNLHLTPIRNED